VLKKWLNDPTDLAVLAQVGRGFLAAVVSSGLPRAGKEGAVRLKRKDFVGYVERLAWAKANGCPWDERTCAYVARGGQLEVLRWAREEHHCPWNELQMCTDAATSGNLEMLRWARENNCPWDASTCSAAAKGGHLEVLRCGRGSATARGTGGHVLAPLGEGTWTY